MTAACVDCQRPVPPLVRGLCRACYHRHKCAGTLADYPRATWPAGDLLDEWALLRNDGYSVRDAAARLGVTFEALCRALSRAQARGDARGRRLPFGQPPVPPARHVPS